MTSGDLWVTAQTIWGEARGEVLAGRYAVAHVIRNRARQRQRSPQAVCLQPRQFSCWNAGDANYPQLLTLALDNAAFRLCLVLAAEVLGGVHADNTRGATHYYARGSTVPRWARGHTPCVTIDHHLFFNDVA
jgi:N-acetylmuramoyl-L-alanine amidase